MILASSDPSIVEDVADSASDTAESVADSAVDQLQSFSELFQMFGLENILTIAVRVLVIIVVLAVGYRILRMLVNRAYKARYLVGRISEENRKQLETSRRIVLSVIFYSTIIIGAMAVLSIFGFDIRALAASAGIAGAALVLISQNVILDWINGLFILVERQFSVGDNVKISDYYGEVKSITIRHTVITTDFNETVVIPNGDINVVVNYSQAPVTQFFDVRIHDAARLDEAQKVLEQVCGNVNVRHAEQLTEPCTVLGVQEIIGTGLTMRLMFKSMKDDTYPILRSLRSESIHLLGDKGLQQQIDHHGKGE